MVTELERHTEHKSSYFGEKITSFVNPGALAQAVP